MFTLDARTESANVEKAQAQVLRDRASVLDFERQLKRSTDLLSKNFIAQGAVDTLQSQLDAARALLAADQAALRAAQVDSSYTILRAPLSGRVGAIGVYPGSLVQPTTSLTSITQLDPIDVVFTLPESSLSALLSAQKAGEVPVTALLADAGGKQVQGKLNFIDNAVDADLGHDQGQGAFRQYANRSVAGPVHQYPDDGANPERRAGDSAKRHHHHHRRHPGLYHAGRQHGQVEQGHARACVWPECRRDGLEWR